MRVAVIADSHFDESPGGRFEECIRIHDWIAEDLSTRGVDLVLHSGDVFERKSTPRERAAVADWLRRVAEIAPVVLVRGNHDAVFDLAIFSHLRTRHPVIVEEAAAVHVVAGVAVGCLAWPRKAELLSLLGSDVGREESEQVAGDALRNVLRGLGAQMAEHDGPRILLAHAMVTGSKVSTGQPLVGCDLEIGVEDLGLCGADFYALGHIHLPQHWEPEDGPIVYPGSPRRTAFGETEEKGYVVAELGAAPLRWERVPTPATPMLLLTGRVTDIDCPETGEAFRGIVLDNNPEDEELAGAEIRLRYVVASDEREAARGRAAEWKSGLLARGAVSVKLEEQVVATTRARAPEVAAARSLEEKLRAVWEARGEVPEEERAARLIGKAHAIEEEVRNAL